ncbi:MAG: PRC-barrel domain-containing protein [Candidatus Micrarchaeia archaeon]|jgi:sporulation protein YlmC with PRC-barrel domain
MKLSEIYGKKIITSAGKMVGDVKAVVLDMENGEISHLLTTKLENLAKSGNVKEALSKNSVLYKRVKSVAESIIVSEK